MRTITKRVLLRIMWVGVCNALMFSGIRCLAQTPSGKSEIEPQSASPMLRRLLTEIKQANDEKNWKQAAQISATALEQAKTANDGIGIAQVLQEQAQAQEGLGNIEQALVAWQECEAAWKIVGDGPGRAEALGHESLLHYLHKEAETGKRELDTLLRIAEDERPVSLAATLHNSGKRFLDKGLLPQTRSLFEKVLRMRHKIVPESEAEGNALYNLGLVAYQQEELKASDEYYLKALAIYQNLVPDSLDVADCLRNLGKESRVRGDLKAAKEYYLKALPIFQKLNAVSENVANCFYNLGTLAKGLRDLKSAEECFQKALSIYQKFNANSEDVAGCYINLGGVSSDENDIKSAEEYFQRALSIYQKFNSTSKNVAMCFYNLGVMSRVRSDLKAAEEYYLKALPIFQKNNLDAGDEADCLNNLGVVAKDCGNLKAAEEYYQKSLAIYQKKNPASKDVAVSFNNLGGVANDCGDLKGAEEYYQKALDIYQRTDSDPENEAACLNNLSHVALQLGKLNEAREYSQEALSIYQKHVAPGSEGMANCYINLGVVAHRRGEVKAAEYYYRKALSYFQLLALDSISVAKCFTNLGAVAKDLGAVKEAEDYYQKALTIYQKQNIVSINVVRTIRSLCNLLVENHEPERAISLLQQAADILQHQRNDIRDLETRSLFFEQNASIFTTFAKSYLETGRSDKAIEVLESARARTLLDQRAERFLLSQNTSPNDVPKELLLQKQDLDNQRHITLTQRQYLDEKRQADLFQQNTRQLKHIAAEERQLETESRRQSPRYANLVYPTPLTLAQMQQGLEEGTLVLLYAVGEDECDLYTITHTIPPQHYSLPIGAKKLAELTRKFRASLDPKEPRDLDQEEECKQYARQLYSLLIAPAQAEVNTAQRLLICPDNSLYEVAFAALMHPKEPGDTKDRFLIEDKPLGLTMSLGVYLQTKQEAQTRRQQPPPGLVPLYALGDDPNVLKSAPTPAPKPGKETALVEQPERERFVRLGGKKLDPVPQTGVLAQHLGALYGKASLVRIGKDATKRSVLTEAVKSQVLNLSCHGLLDNGDPLASCLALTPDAADSGLLYAYEVLGMHLPGSHVVLGACETGLGGAQGLSQSEGVVGLTRAFLYAGAENVVVSLWSVEVNSSVALLEELHKELHAGKGMSVALRDAQLRLLHGTGAGTAEQRKLWQRPSFWAPFLNYGLLE